MFLHFERICVRIQRSGLILFQFQVNFDTVLLFSWTVWCVWLELSVCEGLRANVDVIYTFGSVLMYFQVWICFYQVRSFFPPQRQHLQIKAEMKTVCVNIKLQNVTTHRSSQDFYFHFIHDLWLYSFHTELANF